MASGRLSPRRSVRQTASAESIGHDFVGWNVLPATAAPSAPLFCAVGAGRPVSSCGVCSRTRAFAGHAGAQDSWSAPPTAATANFTGVMRQAGAACISTVGPSLTGSPLVPSSGRSTEMVLAGTTQGSSGLHVLQGTRPASPAAWRLGKRIRLACLIRRAC